MLLFGEFSRGSLKPEFASLRPVAATIRDFWKPLREQIQDSHKANAKLQDVLSAVTDPKKLSRYPAAIRAYKKFVGKKKLTWFKPPSATWSYEGLNVRVNPICTLPGRSG